MFGNTNIDAEGYLLKLICDRVGLLTPEAFGQEIDIMLLMVGSLGAMEPDNFARTAKILSKQLEEGAEKQANESYIELSQIIKQFQDLVTPWADKWGQVLADMVEKELEDCPDDPEPDEGDDSGATGEASNQDPESTDYNVGE